MLIHEIILKFKKKDSNENKIIIKLLYNVYICERVSQILELEIYLNVKIYENFYNNTNEKKDG